jgi:preprotein translocase subunit YajC
VLVSLVEQFVLLAEQAEQPASWLNFAPIMPFLLVFILYVILIQRPQRREQAARQALLKNIKKNDRVVTTSGIYGVVTSVQADADEITIRVDETNNTKLRMRLASVAHVLGDETPAEKELK